MDTTMHMSIMSIIASTAKAVAAGIIMSMNTIMEKAAHADIAMSTTTMITAAAVVTVTATVWKCRNGRFRWPLCCLRWD